MFIFIELEFVFYINKSAIQLQNIFKTYLYYKIFMRMKNIILQRVVLLAMMLGFWMNANGQVIPWEPNESKTYWVSTENGMYLTASGSEGTTYLQNINLGSDSQVFKFVKGDEHGNTVETSAYFLTSYDNNFVLTDASPSQFKANGSKNQKWHVVRIYKNEDTGKFAFYFCGSDAVKAAEPRNNLGYFIDKNNIRTDRLGSRWGNGEPTAAECTFTLVEVTEEDNRPLANAIKDAEDIVNAVEAIGETKAIGSGFGQYGSTQYATLTTALDDAKGNLGSATTSEMNEYVMNLTNAKWDLFRSVVVPDGVYYIVYDNKYMTVPDAFGNNQRPSFTTPIAENLKKQVFVLTKNTGNSYKVEDIDGHFLNEKPFMIENPNASSGGYSDEYNNIAFFYDIVNDKYAARNVGPQANALKVGSWSVGNDILSVDNQNLTYGEDAKPCPAASAFFFTLKDACVLNGLTTTPESMITPAFDSYITDYNVNVTNAVSNIIITPSSDLANLPEGKFVASLKQNDIDFEGILNEGENEIEINLTVITPKIQNVNAKDITKTYNLIVYRGQTVTWTGSDGEKKADWNFESNWVGNNAPRSTDDVIIRGEGNESNNAQSSPILEDETFINTIIFEPGAELGNQHLLNVGGTIDASIEFKVFNEGTRWTMLSLPVTETKKASALNFKTSANDDANPYSWIKEFTPSTDAAAWTYLAPSDDLPGLGEGFAFSIGKFEGEDLKAWGSDYPASITGKLTNDAKVETTLTFGLDNEKLFALVGNPFMTSIDFSKLAANNTGIIKDYYMIWTMVGSAEGFAGYYAGADGGFSFGINNVTNLSDKFISPLQAFFVEKGTAEGKLRFDLADEGEDIKSIAATGSGELRSATSSDYSKLDIVAENGTVAVKTFIANKEGMTSARKLKNGCGNIPDVYTLSSDKTDAFGAQFVQANPTGIPLAIATAKSGNMSLIFSGMSSYENTTISLIDNVKKETIVLTGDSYRYDFDYTPKTEGSSIIADETRFLIAFSPKNITGIDAAATNDLSVFAKNNKLQVASAYIDPIHQIEVYDMQGRLICNAAGLNVTEYAVELPSNATVYLVKITTASGVKNVKISNK